MWTRRLHVLAALFWSVAFCRSVQAHDGEGGFWDRSGCCDVYYSGHCTVPSRADHPEEACRQGHEVDDVETDGCGCLWGRGECVPTIETGSVPELPNGRDDDCDYYVDDEQCDGIDNDSDGRVDEDRGSCLLKIFFVPLSWGGSQAEFEAAAQAQWNMFSSSLSLAGCPDNFAHHFASVAADNLPAPDCSLDCGVDAVITSFREHFGAGVEADYNVVAAITDGDLCGTIAGCRDAGGFFIWAQAGNSSEPILAHELGHVFGLRDEYCSLEAGSDDPRCNQGQYPLYSAPPNYLGIDLLCDPRGGYGCCDGCRSGAAQICCEGNVNPLGGRDIMSYAEAAAPRAFDARSAAHLRNWTAQTVPMDCGFAFEGLQRMATLTEEIDDQGQMSISSGSVGFARPGLQNFGSTGRYGLEILDAGGERLHASAEDLYFDYSGPVQSGVDATGLRFQWVTRTLRIPLGVGPDGPFKVRSLLDGVAVAQTCLTPGAARPDGSVELTVDRTPPELHCPADAQLECRQHGGTSSSDRDLAGFLSYAGDHVTDSCDSAPAVTHNAPSLFPAGSSPVTFQATDADGNSSSCTARVTVADSTSPELSVAATPRILWPPDHRYAVVSVSVSATDICDGAVSGGIELVSVSSDEPEDTVGLGDGHTRPDIVIVDLNTVKLRRERSGRGNGRVYTLNYRVTDAAGNSAAAAVTVAVPQRVGGAAVDSGAVYVVTD